MVGLSHSYLCIKAAISFFVNTCNQVPFILPKMQDQTLFTCSWHSFSRCGRVCEYARFANQGGEYVENNLWSSDVNMLWLTVALQNTTTNVTPERQNNWLEPTGLANLGKTHWLAGSSAHLDRQEFACRDFRRVWKHTNPVLSAEP